jgi:hypothetical protein
MSLLFFFGEDLHVCGLWIERVSGLWEAVDNDKAWLMIKSRTLLNETSYVNFLPVCFSKRLAVVRDSCCRCRYSRRKDFRWGRVFVVLFCMRRETSIELTGNWWNIFELRKQIPRIPIKTRDSNPEGFYHGGEIVEFVSFIVFVACLRCQLAALFFMMSAKWSVVFTPWKRHPILRGISCISGSFHIRALYCSVSIEYKERDLLPNKKFLKYDLRRIRRAYGVHTVLYEEVVRV